MSDTFGGLPEDLFSQQSPLPALGGCFDVPSSPHHDEGVSYTLVSREEFEYITRRETEEWIAAFEALPFPSLDEFYQGFMNEARVVEQYLPFMGVNATSVASTPEPRSVSSLSSVSTQTTSDADTQTDAPPTATVLPPKPKAVKRTQPEDAAPAAAPKPKRRR